MKKTLICMLMAVSTASVFAQGTVNYAAFVPTYISFQTNGNNSPLFGGQTSALGAAAPGLAANGYYYELLFKANGATQPTSASALSTWTDSTFYAVNSTASAGKVTAGNGTTGSAVAGMTVGTTYSVMVVGWSANLGNNWTTVLGELQNWNYSIQNAYFGMTSVGTVTPGTTTAPGANLFGTGGLINSPNTQLYSLPTPEPGTIALAGLGIAGLLALRRKK